MLMASLMWIYNELAAEGAVIASSNLPLHTQFIIYYFNYNDSCKGLPLATDLCIGIVDQ